MAKRGHFYFALTIIGLMDPTSKNAYTGKDFYSRLDQFPARCPASYKEELSQFTPIFQQENAPNPIWLFGGSNWEGQLLGRWDFSETGRLQFVEGELIKKLQEFEESKHEASDTLSINLNNAPWDNEDFVEFLQNALHHRVIKIGDREYPLPPNFSLTKSQDYPWGKFAQHLQINPALASIPKDAHVLNPTLFSRFLSQRVCDNQTHTLKAVPGLLEQHRGETLCLYISAPLSRDMMQTPTLLPNITPGIWQKIWCQNRINPPLKNSGIPRLSWIVLRRYLLKILRSMRLINQRWMP